MPRPVDGQAGRDRPAERRALHRRDFIMTHTQTPAAGGQFLIATPEPDDVFIREETGELLLSREIKDIARSHNASMVLVGTYSAAANFTYVSLKFVRTEDSRIIRAFDYALPNDKDVNKLLQVASCDMQKSKLKQRNRLGSWPQTNSTFLNTLSIATFVVNNHLMFSMLFNLRGLSFLKTATILPMKRLLLRKM